MLLQQHVEAEHNSHKALPKKKNHRSSGGSGGGATISNDELLQVISALESRLAQTESMQQKQATSLRKCVMYGTSVGESVALLREEQRKLAAAQKQQQQQQQTLKAMLTTKIKSLEIEVKSATRAIDDIARRLG